MVGPGCAPAPAPVPIIECGGLPVRSLVRRLLIPALAVGLVWPLVPAGAAAGAATVGASAARAARTVPGPLFGQHVSRIAEGVPSGLTRVGAIRLWDAGVQWRQVETARGVFDWTALDAAVANAEALGAREILYTLGSTPQWAATDRDSEHALYGPGSNSHPRRAGYYLDYLRAVATRYRGRITAYQVWNEANLRDFYLGTPTQLAALTRAARTALRSVDRSAKLVAASTTVRAGGPVGAWGRAYGAAMRRVGWPVDAVSAHFYPPATSGPDTRVAYIRTVTAYYRRHGAAAKPLWDTEISYGDRRAHMAVQREYTGATAATYVARTYIDAMQHSVARVFWYGWDIHVLGTDMTAAADGSVSPGGRAFLAVQAWMSGARWEGCVLRSGVTTCPMRSAAGGRQSIRYAARARTITLPPGTRAIRRLDGRTVRARAGQRVWVTSQPVLVVGG